MESLPRNILADTGPIFSLLHAGDGDHARVVRFSRAFTGLLITTWPVIAEVCYLLEQSNRRGIGVLLGADASLVAVGERLGILDIISLDRRDFSRYRTRARQAFTNHFPPRA